MIRMISALFTILAVFACRKSSSLTENERATIITDTRQMLENYHTDIRDSGLTAEFKYLDSTKEFYWVPPGYSTPISYDSVATMLNQTAPNYKLVDNSFNTLRINPLSQEYATYTGRLKSTMTDTAGITTTFSLMETGVLVKRRDGWKLLRGQTSLLSN